ncbi:MAG: hypothetical protein JNM18_23720 [Planctomycetaceae bacterium]|nr:hypothetical protein [Planctomycetaceae bacterium]
MADGPPQSLLGWDAWPGFPVSDAVYFVVIGMSVTAWFVIARLIIHQARSRKDFIQTALTLVLVPILLGWFVALWKYEQLLAGDIFTYGELASTYYNDPVSGGLWLAFQTLLWSIPSWLMLLHGSQVVHERVSGSSSPTASSVSGEKV